MTLPDFFVIGAAKAGTTSLYATLQKHPEVFLPAIKEPRYFAFADQRPQFCGPEDEREVNSRTVFERDSYEALYADATHGAMKGDMSPLYLAVDGTADRVAAAVPQARIVAVLRDPADRAFSQWKALRSVGAEPADFETALDEEQERITRGWSPLYAYRGRGLYHRQLLPYLERFPPERIHLILFDDLCADPSATLEGLCRFLSVDQNIDKYGMDAPAHENISVPPRSAGVQRLTTGRGAVRQAARFVPAPLRHWAGRSVRAWNVASPTIEPATRRSLLDSFAPDIHSLSVLLDRDLAQLWRP